MVTRGILTEVSTATAGVLAADEIKKAVKEFFASDVGKRITEKVGKRIGEMFDPDNNRVDMINFIYGPLLSRSNGIPTRNIARYLKNAMKDPMGDNSVVQVLCLVFKNTRAKDPDNAEKYLYPDPKDDQYLLDVFEDLGLLSEEEFRERLEHWDHDRAGQLFKYVGRQIKKGVDTAGSWSRAFIALTALWFYLIIRSSLGGASQTEMWTLALAPGIALFLLSMFINPLAFPLAHWLSEKFKIGFTRFAGKVFMYGLTLAFLLSIWPMPSHKMALLLTVGVIGMFFARLAKTFWGTVLSLLIIGYVAYGIHEGKDITNRKEIKAAAEAGIAKAVEFVGLGPGSSESNPIILNSNPTGKTFMINAGETLWLQIAPGQWSQRIECPRGTHFNVISFSGLVEQKLYVGPKGRNVREMVIPGGPGFHSDYPPDMSMMSFSSGETILAQIGVKNDRTR